MDGESDNSARSLVRRRAARQMTVLALWHDGKSVAGRTTVLSC